jgi:hypothetical protein
LADRQKQNGYEIESATAARNRELHKAHSITKKDAFQLRKSLNLAQGQVLTSVKESEESKTQKGVRFDPFNNRAIIS